MNKHQVLVVGAGPSGSTTAFYLAKQGVDVLMLDKAVFPRDKPCGDVQVVGNFHVFEDMGIMEDIQRVGNADYALSVIDSIGQEIYLQTTKPVAYVTPRKELDDLTCKAAVRAGAELVENFDARELIIEKGTVKGVRGFLDGKYQEYYADITVICCGSHSMLSRQLGIYTEDPNLVHYAARGYYENVTGLPEDCTETYYLKEFSPNGYIWLASLGNGRANVGVFLSEKALRKSNRKLEDWVNWWATTSEAGRKRMGEARLDGEFKGWRISSSKKIQKNYAAGAIIVGDAANMVESFQGEGYPQATEAAIIAADFIPRVLKKGDFSEEALAPYFTATRLKINSTLKLMTLLRTTAFRKPKYVSMIEKAVNSIPNSQQVVNKIAETVLYSILEGADLSNLDWEKYERLTEKESKLKRLIRR